MKYIVWDWNGTLFNDVDLCVNCINRLLVSEDLKPLESLNHYRSVFGFPIQEYYKRAGFDFTKTPYDILAHRYMQDYQDKSYECKLFDDVVDTFKKASELGIKQVILSASKKDYLMDQINLFNILESIDSIWGIEDIYAHSKQELAQRFFETCGKDDEIWFVGDSTHDFEVASSIGANCILVTTGHQSRERLETVNVPVVDSLMEALKVIYETNRHSK